MKTPEIEIPHPLLMTWPHYFQCRIYESGYWREQIELAGGKVESVRPLPSAGKTEIEIRWPVSRREPITIHGPRIPQ